MKLFSLALRAAVVLLLCGCVNKNNTTISFGAPSPEALIELRQFDFMVGNFMKIDSIRNEDAIWEVFKGTWNARYAQDGHTIQDENWNPIIGNTIYSIRVYDDLKKTWFITSFSWYPTRGYRATTLQGQRKGNEIIVYGDKKFIDRKSHQVIYRFYDIQENSYKWVAEYVHQEKAVAFRKISCTRSIASY
ncbi:MAG: hypothetical protein QNJ57_06785 [Flavobacteriaceae bacterium]|nr:hypothetical protein [Flavobacteriaceae bacterium]